jgi:hypothetical protein
MRYQWFVGLTLGSPYSGLWKELRPDDSTRLRLEGGEVCFLLQVDAAVGCLGVSALRGLPRSRSAFAMRTSYRKVRTSEARSGSTVAGLFGRAACGEPNETPSVHEHDPSVVE